ncbi:MAG: YkgJ family cysteine cluster protein [Candidatus Methanoperedens sp.]|nr:YkgJ family cysteine cluster protein [Candidatus Methanoperedens sp.]
MSIISEVCKKCKKCCTFSNPYEFNYRPLLNLKEKRLLSKKYGVICDKHNQVNMKEDGKCVFFSTNGCILNEAERPNECLLYPIENYYIWKHNKDGTKYKFIPKGEKKIYTIDTSCELGDKLVQNFIKGGQNENIIQKKRQEIRDILK